MTGPLGVVVTIVLFLVVLGSLVLIHELGHFVVARLAGIRVLEFGIGFPPRAKVLRSSGETLYTLNWLPIGGFVKLEGEDGDDDRRPALVRRGAPAGQGDHPRRRRRDEPRPVARDLHLDRLARRAGRRDHDPEVEPDSPAAAAGPQGAATPIVSVNGRHDILRRRRASSRTSATQAGQTVTLTVVHPGRHAGRRSR